MSAGAGWNWVAILGAAGSIAGVVAIFLHYADKPEQVEAWVEKDGEYRAELAAKLRGAPVGATYRDLLTRGLDWLDRKWGKPGSSTSLGIYIIIALCYAYAAFLLAWGVGGPSHIGGVFILSEIMQPARGFVAFWAVVALPLSFVFGRWLEHQERHFKLQVRRRKRWRPFTLEVSYRAVLAGFLFITVTATARFDPIFIAGYATLFAVAPTVGIVVVRGYAPRCGDNLFGAAAGAGVAVIAIVLIEVVAVPGMPAATPGSLVAAAAAIAGAGAVAGLGAVAALWATSNLGLSSLGLVSLLLACVAAATGAASAQRRRKGAIAAGFGCLIGGALFAAFFLADGLAGDLALISMLFFLVLPIINGLWDWLSWRITRGLGRHLLASFGEAGSLRRRAAVVVGHGALDLALAVALLAAMAFFLAFGFEGYNRIAVAQRGEDLPVFALGPFLADAADHPWTEGLWLTVMLISTLVPTALHMVALLASPLALVTLPTEERLTLAGELESYDLDPARQGSIQRRAGRYVARERHSALALAAGLLVLLLAGLLALINLLLGLIEEGETIAHLVLGVAEWGIAAARMLFG